MSPITVGESVVTVVDVTTNRLVLFLQNTGKNDIYFKKQVGRTVSLPSSSNYDFILYSNENKGISEIFIESTAKFLAVVPQPNDNSSNNGNGNGSEKTSTLAWFETIQFNYGCR